MSDADTDTEPERDALGVEWVRHGRAHEHRGSARMAHEADKHAPVDAPTSEGAHNLLVEPDAPLDEDDREALKSRPDLRLSLALWAWWHTQGGVIVGTVAVTLVVALILAALVRIAMGSTL